MQGKLAPGEEGETRRSASLRSAYQQGFIFGSGRKGNDEALDVNGAITNLKERRLIRSAHSAPSKASEGPAECTPQRVKSKSST